MYTAGSVTWWDRLWPLLATAALSLLVLAFVTLYVAPKMESRKRREDRWERDVLALGELLIFEFADVSDKLLKEIWWGLALEDIDDIDAERRRQARVQNKQDLRDARDAFRRAMVRAEWLVDRISQDDLGRKDIWPVWTGVIALGMKLDQLDPTFRTKASGSLSLTEYEETTKTFRTERKDLLSRVQTLAGAKPARRPTRATRMRRDVGARWRRFRKSRAR